MNRLPGLGGLRAIAALLVVAFHAFIVFSAETGDTGGAFGWFLFTYGWTGVDLFFVLSAFLLALPLVGPTPRPLRWHVFASKRLMRIAPPYYATMALTAVILGAHPLFRPSVTELWRHAFYVHNLFPESVMALNAVFWTLAVEMQFYLILPFLVPLVRSRSWPVWLGVAAIVTFAWRAFLFTPGDAALTFWKTAQVPGFAFHFALGLTAARLHASGFRLPRPTLVAAAALALFVALPLALFDHQVPWFGSGSPGTNMFLRPTLAIGFALVVLAVVAAGSRIASWLDGRIVGTMGEASYSLYLVHYPVMAGMVVAAPAIVALGVAGFVALTATASVLVAFGVYHAVERPSLSWKANVTAWLEDVAARRTGRARRAASIAAASATATAATPTATAATDA